MQRPSEARVAKADAETSSDKLTTPPESAGSVDRIDTSSFEVAALQFRPSWASDNDGPLNASVSAESAALAQVIPVSPAAVNPVIVAGANAAPEMAKISAPAHAAVPNGPIANTSAAVVVPPPVAVPVQSAPQPATGLATGLKPAAPTAFNGANVGPTTFAPSSAPSVASDDDDLVIPTANPARLYIAGGVGVLALLLLIVMFSGSKEPAAPTASATNRVTMGAPAETAAAPSRVVSPPAAAPTPIVQQPLPAAPVPQTIPIVEAAPAPPIAEAAPPAAVQEPAARTPKVSKRKRERTVAPTRSTRTAAPVRAVTAAPKPAATRTRTTAPAKTKRGAGLINANPY